MPRHADPKNAVKNASQAKWRAKQRAMGRPEVSPVDVAVAAAFSAMLSELEARKCDVPKELFGVVNTAISLLAQKCDLKESKRKVGQRLHFRKDLPALRAKLVTSDWVSMADGNE